MEDVAEVISQAFAADPLILWLLDDQGPTWDKLEPSLQRWQQFRVEDAAINGVVLGAFQTGESSTQETCRGAVLMFPTSQRQSIQVMKRTMQYGYLKWYWKRFSIGMDAPNTNQQVRFFFLSRARIRSHGELYKTDKSLMRDIEMATHVGKAQ